MHNAARSTRTLGCEPLDMNQLSPATPQWKRAILPCTVLGCIVVLIGDKLDDSGLEYTWSVGITAIMFFLTGLLVGRVFGAAAGFSILSIGLGIAVGTFLSAVLDPTRNLWPIEIVVYCVVGAVPVALGMLLGAFWRTQSATRSAK